MDRLTQLPQVAIIAEKDGFYRATTRMEYLGPQNEMLRTVAQNLSYDIFGVGVHPKLLSRIHISISGTSMVVYTRLPALNLRTTWTLFDNGAKLYPAFLNASKAKPSDMPSLALQWTPPESMGLWYITDYAVHPTANVPTYNWNYSYLVAVKKGTTPFYRLPTGNVGDAGSICMGTQFRDNNAAPLLDRFTREIDWFNETEWNEDLMRSSALNFQAVFPFKSDKKQLPSAPDWEKHCLTMNTRVYSNLPLHKLSFS